MTKLSLSLSKLALSLLTALGTAGPAMATTTIDFESTLLGSYSSLTIGGVTITGDLTVADEGPQYVNGAPGSHYLHNRSGAQPFTFTFGPTDYFGLQVGVTNAPQSLMAFDASYNFLGSVSIPNQVLTLAFPYTDFYSLAFPGIVKVILTANNNDSILVDNVTVGTVPEPETWALMGLGLSVLALARRRKAA